MYVPDDPANSEDVGFGGFFPEIHQDLLREPLLTRQSC